MSEENKIVVCSQIELKQLITEATKPLADELRRLTDLKTYTLKEAEGLTGISWQKLRRAHLAGNLHMKKEGNEYRVKHTDLQTYIDTFGEGE